MCEEWNEKPPLFKLESIYVVVVSTSNNNLRVFRLVLQWFEKPEHDVFSSYFLRRQIIPEENFYIIDPRSLWAIWDFLDLNSNLPVIKNPPSSGLLGA